jgi:hypothetical protein
MDSVIKVTCSRREIEELCESRKLNVRFYAFDVKENGFDQRILNPEQFEEEIDTPWTYVVRVRHADFGKLADRYDCLDDVISEVRRRGSEYVAEVRRQRKERFFNVG